jgi:hypothetical protein
MLFFRMAPNPATFPAYLFLISNPLSSYLYAINISYFNPEDTDIIGKTIIYTNIFVFINILLYLAKT